MSTYFTKKKLLDQNSDLYISEYDKGLGISQLQGIIDAKRSYAAAKEAGDSVGMEEANKRANEIRTKSGGYHGGQDGSDYAWTPKSYEVRTYGNYSSPYQKDKDRVKGEIASKKNFTYSIEDDPVYAVYAKIYKDLGEDAYDRALAKNAMRTGGVASTSAQSLAIQAQNKYNSYLASKIPELYSMAYDRYMDDYDRLYKELETLDSLDQQEYKRYRDMVSDWEKDREYYRQADEDRADREWESYKFDTNLEYDLAQDEYKSERHSVEDEKWRREFGADVHFETINSINDKKNRPEISGLFFL